MNLTLKELQKALDVQDTCATPDGTLVAAWQYFPATTNFLRYSNGEAYIHKLPTPKGKTISFPDKIVPLSDGTFEISTSHMDKVSWIVSIKDNEVKAKIKGSNKTVDCPPTKLTPSKLVQFSEDGIEEDEDEEVDIDI